MGRLHTCYSPVRRSPATESKLSAPLPLDLHVLSLSLAFILSQDQTLRCLSCLFSFSNQKKQNKQVLFVLLSQTFNEAPFPRPSDSCYLLVKKSNGSFFRFKMTLVLLLVYCKSFSVRLAFSFKASAKLRHVFHSRKSFNFYFSQRKR